MITLKQHYKPFALLIFSVVFFILQTTAVHSQETSAVEIWNKMVQANRPWLFSPIPQVYYEIDETDTISKTQNKITKIWYQSPDQLLYGDCLIINGFMRRIEENKPKYLFNVTIPESIKTGGSRPTIFAVLAEQKRMPSSLKVSGRERLNGNDAVVMEASNINGEQPGLPGRPFDDFNLYNDQFPSVQWYVDESSGLLLKEKTTFQNRGMASFLANEINTDFPEGYVSLPQGFAPRMARTIIGRNFLEVISRFQVIDGQYWFLSEATMNVTGMGMQKTRLIKNISLQPIDENLFKTDPNEMEICDPSEGVGIITGTILDKDSRQPIEGAVVRVVHGKNASRKPVIAEIKSHIDGTFRFERLPLGILYVTAEKKDMLADGTDSLRPVDYNPSVCSIGTAFLENSNPQKEIDLFLCQGRKVQGSVVHGDTQLPLENVNVFLLESSYDYRSLNVADETKTNNQGQFYFTKVPAAKFSIVAQASGFCGAENPLQKGQQNVPWQDFSVYQNIVELNLQENNKQKNPVILLYPELTLFGRVLNAEGQPVADANVICYPLDKTVASDQEGKYRISGFSEKMPAAELTASASGYVMYKEKIPAIHSSLEKDIVMKRGGKIGGTVFDEQQQPVKGVKISVINKSKLNRQGPGEDESIESVMPGLFNPGLVPVFTDDNGAFQTGRLIPDDYVIHAATDGYQPQSKEDLLVEDDKEIKTEIILKKSSKIAGQVVSPTGAPLKNVIVYCGFKNQAKSPEEAVKQQLSQPPEPVITDQEGRFVFDRLIESIYFISAQWGHVLNENGKNFDEKDEFPITTQVDGIKPGKLDLILQFKEEPVKKIELKGIVADEQTGLPVTNFYVYTLDGDRSYRQEFSSPDGKFILAKSYKKSSEFAIVAAGYASQLVGPVSLIGKQDKEIFVALKREGSIRAEIPVDVKGTLNWDTFQIKPAQVFLGSLLPYYDVSKPLGYYGNQLQHFLEGNA